MEAAALLDPRGSALPARRTSALHSELPCAMQPLTKRLRRSRASNWTLSCFFVFLTAIASDCHASDATIGILVPLRWSGADGPLEAFAVGHAASAAMAAFHINNRDTSLVPGAEELLPAGFKLVFDIQDTMAAPSVAVNHVVKWNGEGVHAVVGSYRSAVTGPLALAASIEATPVISWGSTASTLTDRATYPTLSRTVVNDAILAASTIRTISLMGWTRISVLYVNDAWGRAFFQDASASASQAGVEIVVAAAFELGNAAQIENAVRQVAESGAKITFCIVFDGDLEAVASLADAYGLLKNGHAWLLNQNLVNEVVANSAEPEKTRAQLTGWLEVVLDHFEEGGAERFEAELRRTPIQHLQHPVLNGAPLAEIISSRECDVYCGTIYDAVWTAAIAISRVGVAADGSVDKAALLAAIRNVSFEGATGAVRYDRNNGERDAADLPLRLRNVQQVVDANGTVSLAMVSAWRWLPGADGNGVLERQSNSTPVWPGGERSWLLPVEVLECEAGSVFSSSSLQCEPCPAGTAAEDGVCVRYDARVGILAPLRWSGADGPLNGAYVRSAAAAAMAAQHINNRDTSLVPGAEELLPAGFKLVFDIQDTMAAPSVAVNHVVKWNGEGVHAVVGSYRSAVTGPAALAASIEATPVISWGSTASTLTDRATYPTLSRTVVNDAILAASTIRSLSAIGWGRIAIIYVNDAWGRAFARDAATAAHEAGVRIAASVGFNLGEKGQIDQAVSQIAAANARVILCLAFAGQDVVDIGASAEAHGLLTTGHAWVSPEENMSPEIAAASSDPESTRRHLTGWLTVAVDAWHGAAGARFQRVLEEEALPQLPEGPLLSSQIAAGIASAPCNQFCGLTYDAVWVAAIAVGRVGLAEDGSVDKAALLDAIRNVSFDGATGRVQFDQETGERDAGAIPLLIKNFRPINGTDGKPTLALEATWRWQSGELARESSEPPIWPGGLHRWNLPTEQIFCAPGLTFSPASLQCEPCPRGMVVEQGKCVRYDASLGVLVPLRWSGADGPLELNLVRHAASAAMAAFHINNRVTSLVPGAEELLPAGFKLVFDIQDTMAAPSVAVNHVVKWNGEGVHAVVGSYRSAVTGPLALAASIDSTPVVVWGGTASTLSDRETYPTLSRTVVNDAIQSAMIVRAINTMGWTRIAILYVNDAWGRGFIRDAMKEAAALGVDVVAAAGFALGQPAEIDTSIKQIADSGARIVVCVAFETDYGDITAFAEQHGLLGTGYAWVAGGGLNFALAADISKDPPKTRQRMAGWLEASTYTMHSGLDTHFQHVLATEPINHMDHAALDGAPLAEIISSGECDVYCGTIYDAVWTAAIAISRVGVAADGSVDKAALLDAIRNVSFEGATGAVRYDRNNGERDAADLPLRLRNVQQVVDANGTVSLAMVSAWRWLPGADGNGVLERQSDSTPVWPGGERSWLLPVEVLECEAGSVFSSSSLQCEPCPAGTAAEDGVCVRYDARVGILAPLRWSGADGPLDSVWVRSAAAAAMAAQHINNRDTSLVPGAEELLPAGFKLVFDIQDTMAAPSVAVNHVVKWNGEGVHAVVGSLRSAVTGPLALAASIEATPVISWGSTASTLSDRDTYPHLFRTVISDFILAESTIRSLRAVGWSSIAVLYVNDAWGRSMSQDLTFAGSKYGIEIAVLQPYVLGDRSGIRDVVASLADLSVRVFLVIAYDNDLSDIVPAVDDFGMLNPGYAWLLNNGNNIENVIAQSADPQRTEEQLVGWMLVYHQPFHGARGEKFQEVFVREPLDSLSHDVFDGGLTEEIRSGSTCDQLCGLIYDAVWIAAIGISRVGLANDGSVDKAALSNAIQNVEFDGATGRVQFDAGTGERDPRSQALLVFNVQPKTARRTGEAAVSAVLTWQWWAEGGAEGRLEELGSEAPFWPGRQQTWDPPADRVYCPDGFFFSRTSFACEPCPPGSRLVDDHCELCEVGTFAAEPASISCSRCQVGFANATGMTACLDCPANTVRGPSSPGFNISECLCQVGFYSVDGPGNACTECVTGGYCAGGDQAPHPVEGFWGDSSCVQFGGSARCPKWDTFLPCNPAENCKGGPQFECHSGRTGRLCLETVDGWSNVGGVFFWQCGRNGGWITAGGIVAVVMTWFFINSVASSKFVALNIALLFVQVTALIGAFGLKWHTRLHAINLVMGVANFDVDFVAASCLMPWGPVTSFYFQVCLPFLFGAIYFSKYLGKELWRSWRARHVDREINWKRTREHTQKHFVSFVLINYTTLALKALQPLRCSAFPDGRSYMTFAPSVECWKGGHWFMVCLSVLYVIVILAGLPFWIWLTLRHHIKHGTLHNSQVDRQWGFVHHAFEADWKTWECVLILRRFLVAFIAVMVPEPMLQGAATLCVLAAVLSAQVFTAPFIRADTDILDFLAICGSMLYCLAGMLFYPSVTQNAQGHLCSETSDSRFCAEDGSVKDLVSIVAFTTIVLMVLVASLLTYRNVREDRASAKAARNIRRLQGTSRATSEVAVIESTNRVSLDQILQGVRLLRWTDRLQHQKHSFKYKASSEHFLEVEQSLLALEVDMTPSATHTTADVMRHICEVPGFVDFLLTADEGIVAGLHSFVREFASFLERAEDDHLRFRSQELVRFEHRPFLCFWLSTTDEPMRRKFARLVEAILRACKLPVRRTRSCSDDANQSSFSVRPLRYEGHEEVGSDENPDLRSTEQEQEERVESVESLHAELQLAYPVSTVDVQLSEQPSPPSRRTEKDVSPDNPGRWREPDPSSPVHGALPGLGSVESLNTVMSFGSGSGSTTRLLPR